LVESDKSVAEKLVKAGDLEFAVNADIERTVSVFGDIMIDYVKTIYQKGFTVSFARGGSC
jgi:hypothetical protein